MQHLFDGFQADLQQVGELGDGDIGGDDGLLGTTTFLSCCEGLEATPVVCVWCVRVGV